MIARSNISYIPLTDPECKGRLYLSGRNILNNYKDLSMSKLADTLNMYTYRFSNDKRIFDQMKNSGALRYIKDKNLIDKILIDDNSTYQGVKYINQVINFCKKLEIIL